MNSIKAFLVFNSIAWILVVVTDLSHGLYAAAICDFLLAMLSAGFVMKLA